MPRRHSPLRISQCVKSYEGGRSAYAGSACYSRHIWYLGPLSLPQFILPTTEPAVVSKMLRYFLTELTQSAALQRFTEAANRRRKHQGGAGRYRPCPIPYGDRSLRPYQQRGAPPVGREGGDGFFQKRADTPQEKPLDNTAERAYRLLLENPDIAKLIIATLQNRHSNSLLENLLESPTKLRNDKIMQTL